MFKNYFKTAWRSMVKSKGYAALNILGLAIGMAVAILIGLWALNEFSFDAFHANRKNIGLVMKKTFFNGQKGTQSGVMLPLYTELKMKYPDVKFATRLDWGDSHTLMIDKKTLAKNGHFADPDFLKMFSFPLTKGNAKTALADPYSLVLTQSTARALFGEADPVGKTIRFDNMNNLTVTGVAKDVPRNSTIRFDFLVPYEYNVLTNDFVKGAQVEWRNNFLQTYVQLQDGVSMEAFSAKIANLPAIKSNDTTQAALFLHAMPKWHLYGEFKD
ncbi:MAG TPA: ABC transporter permease, partial [Agriterribacter sp.]|nr:ABC transporter permease [Agriterribacter sp.]